MEPDLIHLYCTPLQAMRMIQGYAYRTGERFEMSCIGIRGVSCDMTSWPYITGRINGTFLCLGARGISGWEEEYVGFGMPFAIFRQVVDGMERSKRGFPYKIFPKMTDEIWPDEAGTLRQTFNEAIIDEANLSRPRRNYALLSRGRRRGNAAIAE